MKLSLCLSAGLCILIPFALLARVLYDYLVLFKNYYTRVVVRVFDLGVSNLIDVLVVVGSLWLLYRGLRFGYAWTVKRWEVRPEPLGRGPLLWPYGDVWDPVCGG